MCAYISGCLWEQGWIEREQILGPEPASRVPPEFQVQKPDIANPPTILLAVHSLLHTGERHSEAVLDASGVSFAVSSVDEEKRTMEFVRY